MIRLGLSVRTLATVAAVAVLAACTGEGPGSDAQPSTSATISSGTPTETQPEAAERTPRPLRRAAKLAGALMAVEPVIGDPATPKIQLRRAARIQQVVYRELGGHPEWDSPVFSRLPSELRWAARANVAARRAFRSMHPPGTLSDTLPAWRIVRPAPARDLLRFYRQAEAEYDVGWEYLAAINLVETAMGRIRGTSTAGAQGPMQFIPSTWAAYGEGDINDPADAIMAAARYLAANGFARPGGVAGALFRYNNSSAYVRGVTLLAQVMERRPRAFHGYYHWQVYFATTKGDVRLPVGYHATKPIPVERWLAEHPQD